MTKLLLLLSLALLTACALSPLPTLSPESLATSAPGPTISSRAATPAIPPSANPVTIDVDVQVADSDTEHSLIVDEVWLDGRIAYRNVSRFVLILDTDYPAEMDGHVILIKAQGYQEWSTRMRTRSTRSRQMFLPVHLLKVKSQS
jgi:hypothetical protein